MRSWPVRKRLIQTAGVVEGIDILNPTPPQYDPGTCDPLYLDDGMTEGMSMLMETESTSANGVEPT